MSAASSRALLPKHIRFGPSPTKCPRFPRGFKASGVHCGIKKKAATAQTANVLDLGLVVSMAKNTSAAGCFTRNVFKAAPVSYCIDQLSRSGGAGIRAVVVNSGCANAVTGQKGRLDAIQMGTTLDRLLMEEEQGSSLVLSTGVIGQHLPIDRVVQGMEEAYRHLSDHYDAWLAAASAFMTTDTFPKLMAHTFNMGGKEICLAGIDKGAGMIHPSMGPPHATLLGLIATDAAIHPESLQLALSRAVDQSFNRISVDGDMSTNDTILCLANGAAGNQSVSHLTHPAEFELFQHELCQFSTQLAQLVVRDGEGATKFVEIEVVGASSESDAQQVAETVAKSALVKCALNGEDANWGRILCAVGYSQVKTIDPTKVSVSFVSLDGLKLKLLVDGEPENVDEAKASELLAEEELKILIDLGGQKPGYQAKYFTTDLSKEFVALNTDYRS